MFGSGKTAFAVREMALNIANRKTYSNIQTNLKNQINISPDMILKKEIVDYKKNSKTGEKEPVYKYSLNTEYWKKIKEPINVTLDEAHTILNSRRTMSKVNIVVSDWLALIRRVLGSSDSGAGEVTFISQLANRIDNIARDMATNVIYVICHFYKTCKVCSVSWTENSEMPEGYQVCPYCQSNSILKHSHKIECWHFPNIQLYQMWHQFGQRTFYKHYFINNIDDNYFKLYNTLQWDNMFSSLY
tara:strand:+ start:5426 stop:6157 length:732 start_codon:yes stop_codon:yes gene_type:complete